MDKTLIEKYKVTIGLEIHAELKTKSKMFSSTANDPFTAVENTHISPVDLAHPGTLPTINIEAVKQTVMVGLALNGQIADFTEFDRKNYFYPDIPKGYQISQYKYPIVSGGELNGIELTRIHLEEDTGTSKHDIGDFTAIDYNRSGVPLMELVTEPNIHSAKEAGDFAREFQILLRSLDVSDANMEKGEMRVELNISVSDNDELGVKVEVKNINSFKAVEKAAEYEIKRMIKLLEEGKGYQIVQETRGWDENKEITFSQRAKESSHDYRYFSDPDLPKMKLSEVFDLEEIKRSLPELPSEKRLTYEELQLGADQIDLLITNFELGKLFDQTCVFLNDKEKARTAANYLTSDVIGHASSKEKYKLPSPEYFSELIEMLSDNTVSSRGAKDILEIMHQHPHTNPKDIAEQFNLVQKSDETEIRAIIEEILKNNPGVVKEYKEGNENSLKFLMGIFMKETKGAGNPQVATKLLIELLK